MRSSCFSWSSSFSSLASKRCARVSPQPPPRPLLSAMQATKVVPYPAGRRNLSICSGTLKATIGRASDLRIGTSQHPPFRRCAQIFPARRLSSVRATQVSGPGSIDSPMIQSMEKKIKEQLDADFVIVKDLVGDGRHVSITVVSKAFEGQSAVNRQRMVYKVIWEELQTTVHAVDQMTTKTPSEASADK